MATCPNCREQLPEISDGKFCPFCGASISPEIVPTSSASAGAEAMEKEGAIEPEPEPLPMAQAVAGTSAQHQGIPWEDRHRVGFLTAFSQTWSDATFRPAAFFRRLPKTGNFGSALLYAVLVGTAAALLSLFWQYLFWESWADLRQFEDIFGEGFNRDLLGLAAVITPIATLVGIFISSLIYHVCLVITSSARYGLEATIRGYCYTYGAYLFVLIPFCGGFIALIWQIVLMVIGWREIHESTAGRVLLAVFLPFILCCGVIIIFMWSLTGVLSRFGIQQ
jgi:hypothetical protein